MKKALKHVEVLGLGVLILVLLAISDTKMSDHLYIWSLEYKAYLVMVPLVIISIAFGFFHAIDRLGLLARARGYFGVLLLLTGGAIFFCLPEYFFTLIASDMDYWSKVSTYSLPAICVEGGLFTLFTEYLEHQRRTTQGEYRLLSTAFLLYATGLVAVNFLVLSEILTVDNQIIFAQGIVIAVFAIGLCVRIRHSREKTLDE